MKRFIWSQTSYPGSSGNIPDRAVMKREPGYFADEPMPHHAAAKSR